MSGMWKRSHGRTSEAPPDERGGYRYVRPTATAPHLDSTLFAQCPEPRRKSLDRTDTRRSVLVAGTGLHAPLTGTLAGGYSRPNQTLCEPPSITRRAG